MGAHGQILVVLEEPLPRVVLAQPRGEDRPRGHWPASMEPQHATQGRRLAADRRGRGPRVPALALVGADGVGRDRGHRLPAEHRAQVHDAPGGGVAAAELVERVLLEVPRGEVVEEHGSARRGGRLREPLLEQLGGLGRVRGPSNFAEFAAVPIALHSPRDGPGA